jgi:hypothetical protein
VSERVLAGGLCDRGREKDEGEKYFLFFMFFNQFFSLGVVFHSHLIKHISLAFTHSRLPFSLIRPSSIGVFFASTFVYRFYDFKK